MSLLSALQHALAVEHAAVYGYGLLGARLSGTELAAAQAAYAAHQNRRDAIDRMVRDLKAAPVVPPPAYRPRTPVTSRSSALRLAVLLEDDGAAASIGVIGATDLAATRRTAVGWLTDSTVRGQAWRTALGAAAVAATPALPGLVEPTPTPAATSSS
ncbi:MAG: hypothetical protein QOG53_2321 [Frankiales bacterium]|nr:hypothetical protein [Frankiales bacterium]